MQKLEELIAALENATGPSLQLDGMIWCAANNFEFVMWDGAGCVYRDPCSPKWDNGIKHAHASTVRPYSASIDAAVALLGRVKPGWFWRGGNVPAGKYERGEYQHGWDHISRTDASNCDRDDEFTGWAATPELALLIAILRAKLSQENTNVKK